MLLWCIDPFMGSDSETNNETTFAARQHILISGSKRPLLGNSSVNMFQRQGIRMETGFTTVVPAEGLRKTTGAKIGMEPPFRENLSPEAEG
jgi:hypothetical protein